MLSILMKMMFSEEDPDLIIGTRLVVITHNWTKRFHLYSLVQFHPREIPFDGIGFSSAIPYHGNPIHCTMQCWANLWDVCVVQTCVMELGNLNVQTFKYLLCQKHSLLASAVNSKNDFKCSD